MKAWVKNLLWAAGLGILAFALTLSLIVLLDSALGGFLADWFELTFLTQVYPWPDIKHFAIHLLLFVVTVGTVLGYFGARLYGRRCVRRALAQAGQLIHSYMRTDLEAGEVFPGDYAMISAQMADVKGAMLKSEQHLREEAARRSDLVMYLAHDIRTPLTSVIGYLSLLAEASEMPADQRAKYVNITLEKALRLERMVNEFFEITRYNVQQISIEKQQVDLCYLLVQLTDELSPALAAKGNTLRLECAESLTLWGDPDQLARVFNNVLKNAAAYSSPGSEIKITAAAQGEWVQLCFQNQGREIPAEKLAAIFERFYRLDDARASNTGGAGLGLAIAREIVSLHGGSIWAESGGGSVSFFVRLPAGPRAGDNKPANQD